MPKWESVGHGVESRKHPDRKHGVRMDRYFRGRYTVNGTTVTVGFGWESEGWNSAKCIAKLSWYKENARTGNGPATPKEEQRIAEENRKAEEEARRVAERDSFTFGQMWEKYLPWATDHKKSWKDEEYYYKKHLEPRFGDKPLAAITSFDIERMKTELKRGTNLQGKPFAAQTIKHQVVIIRRLYNLARKWGVYTGPNPVEGVQMPKVDNQRTEYLSEEELDRLLRTLETWPSKTSAAFVRFALLTGFRRGELFRLKWSHVDLERGMVTLDKPKGGRTTTLPISAEAVEVLTGLSKKSEDVSPGKDRKQKKSEEASSGKDREKKESEYVFPGKDGAQRTDFKGPWERIRKAAELPENFRLHGLRHHFASALVSNGVDLAVVKELLTHKDLTTTQRYAHLAPDAIKAAALKSGKLLTAQKKGNLIEMHK